MTGKSLHLNRDWIYQKYVIENLSTYDIAKLVNRDPKRIYEKLVDFGIQTRPRGHNLSKKSNSGDNYRHQPDFVPTFKGKRHTEETKKVISRKSSVEKPYLRGVNNGMYGKCGDSNPNYIDGSSPERQRIYASGEWKEFARAVYKRDEFRCVRCGTGKTGKKSLHAHHIKSWAGNKSLRYDMNNVITLCRSCHEFVHSRYNTNREFLSP